MPSIADRHPLHRRLSGQVVWNLLAELEPDPATTDRFMDRYFKKREEDLALMAQLEAAPAGFLEIRMPHAKNGCPKCARLHGLVLPARHPRLMEFLPPFSLGCHLEGRFLETATPTPEAELPETSEHNRHRLCCDMRPLSRLVMESGTP